MCSNSLVLFFGFFFFTLSFPAIPANYIVLHIAQTEQQQEEVSGANVRTKRFKSQQEQNARKVSEYSSPSCMMSSVFFLSLVKSDCSACELC